MKYLPSQTAVVEFGVACNRKFKKADGSDGEEVTFVDCTSFGKQAEVINQYFTKGKPIFIEGRLRYDTWDDKQGGGKRSKITVVIENFQFVGGNNDGGGEDRQEERAPPVDRGQMRGRVPAPSIEQQLGEQFDNDDIPL
jgi:single-strand DNA-binding protein